MTDFVDAWPTARKRHRCSVCTRPVLPGETYWRQVALDRSSAWTSQTCTHCERVIRAYARTTSYAYDELEVECILEWLDDEHPTVSTQMRAEWCWPDGEALPLPFPTR